MTRDQDQPNADRDGATSGAHRMRRGGLIDRWYLLLGITVTIALIPVAYALVADDRSAQNPASVMPTLTPASAGALAGAPGAGSPEPSDGSSASGSPAAPSPSPSGSTPPRAPAAATPALPATLTVSATRSLSRGQSWRTASTVVAMSSDGDLVITDAGGRQLWHSDTGSHNPNRAGSQAVMQDDGNLVVYTADQRPVWTSGTAGHPGAVLVLQRDGDVCVVAGGRQLWCARTPH